MIITIEQVRKAMREQELSQAQVARMSKVSQALISNWLSGRLEPSDVSKTRIGLALDIIKAGEADDQQIGAAIAQTEEETAEIPALEPFDEADTVPASAPDADHGLMSDDDAAAEEIMDALGMAEPEPATIVIEPHPPEEVSPEPSPIPSTRFVDMLFDLMTAPNVHLDPKEMTMTISLSAFSDNMAALLWDIDALKAMWTRDAISRYAFDTACASLVEIYKIKEAADE